MTSVTEIPYFEGDFWPNVIEENIKELDQEAKEREASEMASGEVGGEVCGGWRGWRECVGGGGGGGSVWGVEECVGGGGVCVGVEECVGGGRL